MPQEREYWWEDKELYWEYQKRLKELRKEMREKFKTRYGRTSAVMESGATLMERLPR